MDEQLKQYFEGPWLKGDRNFDQYTHSGWALVDKIKPDETVLDVGCGQNLFKDKIPNLHGIDITDVGADEIVSIEDFRAPHLYDVAFCLGSINFGTKEEIEYQIHCVVKALTSTGRIYWRCNPGKADHGNKECKNINFFNWTKYQHQYFAHVFGFKISDYQMDGKRIYCVWSRYLA